MGTAGSFKPLVPIYQATWQHNPEYNNLKKTNFNTGFHYHCVPQINTEVEIP
jgi:hypothetical protein